MRNDYRNPMVTLTVEDFTEALADAYNDGRMSAYYEIMEVETDDDEDTLREEIKNEVKSELVDTLDSYLSHMSNDLLTKLKLTRDELIEKAVEKSNEKKLLN